MSTDPADDTAADDDTDASGPTEPSEPSGSTEPAESTEPAAPARRRWDTSTVRVAAVAVLFAAAFGLAGGLGLKLWQQHSVTSAGHAARQAAVAYAEVLTSIDSDNVDDNFAAVLNGATGEFKDTYTKASVQLRQLLIDNKAAAEGTVVDSAIQSESRRDVVVLLMVDQKVTNTGRPDPRVDRSRMKMTMENVDGRWLASKVELP